MAANPPLPPGRADEFRWQQFFQRCGEPLFLLNRRRTILFVNPAWETLTGLALTEARGLVCRRRRDPLPESPEILQHALAPPPEALAGQQVRVRRLIPGGATGPRWWDIAFLPMTGPKGLLGILGRITLPALEGAAGSPLLPERLVALRERLRQRYRLEDLDSELPALRRVVEQVRLARQTHVPLLLLGEPGTGKEWLARTIHQEGASRERPFVALDCGHLPAAALEAVLFGPAGLISRAGAGTLYLKEPARLPRELQARLTDLVATSGHKTAGAEQPLPQVIAGCGADPLEDVRTGRLLADFHFALSTLTIALPPLRERSGELATLVERMLGQLNRDEEKPVQGLTPEALDVLRAHPWPGNLQELHNVLAEARSRTRGERIEAGDLPWYLRNLPPSAERPLPLDALLEQVERRLIVLALRKSRHNKTRAAEILSIWRPRLLRRMEALGINDQEGESGSQRSKVRGHRSEVRSQKSEDGSDTSVKDQKVGPTTDD